MSGFVGRSIGFFEIFIDTSSDCSTTFDGTGFFVWVGRDVGVGEDGVVGSGRDVESVGWVSVEV